MSHAALPAPDAGVVTRSTLTLHRPTPFHGADETAPGAPPTPRRWHLPNGQQMTPDPRGVYCRNHRRGMHYVLYAVDSSGDDRGYERLVLCTAGQDAYDHAVSELWALLDAVDPLPRSESA